MRLKAYIYALHAALFAILLAVTPAGSGQMSLLGAGKASAGGGCTEATTFLARTSGLSGTETSTYTTMICALVSGGYWSGFDALYFFATNTTTTANLNLVSTSFTITPVSTPTFVTDGCYTTSATAVLDTGIILSAATQYQLNSASLGLAVTTNDTASAVKKDIGVNDGSNFGYMGVNSGLTFIYPINIAGFPNVSATTSRGFWAAVRDGVTSTNAYGNGSSTPLGSNGGTSGARPAAVSVYIGAVNSFGIAEPASREYCAAWVGKGFTGSEVAGIMSIINTALGVFSKNVY